MTATFLCIGSVLLMGTSASAQTRVGFNLTGMWSAMYHEDVLERTDPGSPAGDYLGMPINDDARMRADTWDADLISVPEHQCIPHSSVYGMRAPIKLENLDRRRSHHRTDRSLHHRRHLRRSPHYLDGRASASFAIRAAHLVRILDGNLGGRHSAH